MFDGLKDGEFLAIYTIGDLHLSLSTNKSMEIFKGWENYVFRLERNWKSIVKQEDTVVIVGDISWAMKLEDTKADFSFIHSLPGKKIILKGNHDLWWNSLSKMNKFLESNGFDSIQILHNNFYMVEGVAISGSRGWFFDDDSEDKKILTREVGRIERSIKCAVDSGELPIVFLHYPPALSDSICKEIFDVLNKYGIKQVYYGHIHKGGAFKMFNGQNEGIDLRCVSADMVDFTPVLINC